MTDVQAPARDDAAAIAPATTLTWAMRGLVLLAVIKIIGTAIFIVSWQEPPAVSVHLLPLPFLVLQVTAFAGAGCVLLVAHARDARTARLGTLLMIIAAAFASVRFSELADVFTPARLLAPLQPESFLAWCVGSFIQVFPQPRIPSRATQALTALVRLAGIAGILLFAANALVGWHVIPASATALAALSRTNTGGSVFWTVVFAIIFLMLPLSLTGIGRLDQNTRRRVRVFLGAFLVGFAPTVIVLLLIALPGVGNSVAAWLIHPLPLAVTELFLASIPITVAYAVFVQHMLPVRVVMRLGVQYLLARWTATGMLAIPLCLLIVQGYRLRHETIADAISGPSGWLVAAIVVAGLVLFTREELRNSIDRWFFREAYDAREILMTLGEQSRRVHQLGEFVATLTAGIERALRPDSLAVLILDNLGEHFISPLGSAEPLAAKGTLADALGRTRGPIDVRLNDPRSPLRWLPRVDRQWLVDSNAALLVPMRDAGGGLVGLLSIGERRSEMPFSREDRWLLTVIADAGALTVENHAMRAASDRDAVVDAWRVGPAPEHVFAAECPSCGLLHHSLDAPCVRCQSPLQPSEVPSVLFGKFRFEERVGRGGMSVVYRATDLALERIVAIKTLPGTSPEYSHRLRLEAKAMAAVTHPHLAMIHGAESWRGRPMLICEFMSHGTLASRLVAGPLPAAEALAVGIALADALQVIHTAGLLHRDIKPSNIGYSQDDLPKLLDFGLVHMLAHVPSDDASDVGGNPHRADDTDPLLSLSVSRPFIGTPLYLSPEASHGRHPSAAFDLWSLHVLLIEAITGRHPFRGATLEDTLSRIRNARLDEAWATASPVPHSLTAYFARALARDPASRIKSATETAGALRRLAREF